MTPLATTAPNAPTRHATYSTRARGAPTRTASVRLPGDAIGRRRRARCSRAGSRTPGARPRARPTTPRPARARCCTYALPTVATKPKNDEHHDLAEAEVAVRLRAAGVGDGRRDRGDADEQQPRVHDERRAPRRRPPRRANETIAALRTARGRREAGRGEPHRPAPLRVGAAHAVGVVVGVVDADLQRERDHERRDAARGQSDRRRRARRPRCRRAPARRATPSVFGRAPCAPQPTAAGASVTRSRVRRHGRFGNWSKSGRRFSR